MCRVSLIPEGYTEFMERESVGGGVAIGEEGAATVPPAAATAQPPQVRSRLAHIPMTVTTMCMGEKGQRTYKE